MMQINMPHVYMRQKWLQLLYDKAPVAPMHHACTVVTTIMMILWSTLLITQLVSYN